MGIVRFGNIITLTNDFIRREIDIAAGPTTTGYFVRPGGKAGVDIWLPTFGFTPHAPFEAAVRVGGQVFQAGPWKSKNEFWDRAGYFAIEKADIEKTDLGESLLLHCRPRADNAAPVKLLIRYELAADLPLLIKTVEVNNISAKSLTVDNVTVETICGLRRNTELHLFTDYLNDEPVCKSGYYAGWYDIQFPDPINLRLMPGESFTTFRCFEAAAPNDPDATAIAIHRVLKRLTPWITHPPISQQIIGAVSYDELVDITQRSAKAGIECVHLMWDQLVTNYGDFIFRPDILPQGEEDAKRLVDQIHKLGLTVLPYVGLTIAQHRSRVCQEHPDWQKLGPEGIRFSPEGQGNMCYLSGWGDYIRKKLEWLVDEIGFDGLHIDGPYHGHPCLDTMHTHTSPESVSFRSWQWERDFYADMRERDVYLTVPHGNIACLLLGVNATPAGYTEEDYIFLGGLPLISACRARMYDRRYYTPACATIHFLAIDGYHGNSIEISETTPVTYNHALGGMFGYGHGGHFHGPRIFIGPKTEAIWHRWVEFFRSRRKTLSGEMVHLARPDGFNPDAVMHVAPRADPPAVVVAFNPREVAARISLALPLSYAGFSGGATATVEGYGTIGLDTRGQGLVSLNLKPLEIKTLDITQ